MSLSNNDFTAGLDPTAYTSITGAQLLELVDAGTPFSDKGLVGYTADVAGVPDVPDASVNTKWQRYIWLRVGAIATTPYIWNPNAASDATLLKWQTIAQASIGPGTITNSLIADNTIQDIKIVSLSYSKLSGVPSTFLPGGTAGGDLTGVYPDPSVTANAITTPKIIDSAVTTAKIAPLAVTVAAKLAPAGSALSLIRTNAGATANEFYVPPAFIATDATVSLAAKALKGLRVNAGATDLEAVTANSSAFGIVLQAVIKTIASTSSTTVIPFDNTIPQITEGGALVSIAFTPISATSLIRIRHTSFVMASTSNIKVLFALFKDGAANAIYATGGAVNDNTYAQTVTMEYVLASPAAGVAITFAVRFGPHSAATVYSSGNAIFSTAAQSFITIDEIVGTLS